MSHAIQQRRLDLESDLERRRISQNIKVFRGEQAVSALTGSTALIPTTETPANIMSKVMQGCL